MLLLVRAVAMVVLALFLTAPASALADCDDDHQSDEHPAVCDCFCCTETVFANDAPAALMLLPAKGSVHAGVVAMTGMLLPADIFRPPAAA